MTPREKFIMALEGKQPPGRVPHFELVFFLTMEAFGRVHPSQRHYAQWQQMSDAERDLHRRDIADLYVQTARHYEHSAIFFHPPGGWPSDDDIFRTLDHMREQSGDEFFLMQHGDATWSIPDGTHMVPFVERLADEPQLVKADADRMVDDALERGRRFRRHGALDGLALCADYCFNTGPFLSPAMFDEFVTPYLIRLIAGYRELGFYVVKHTDGNILPILDSLLSARPHALHSLDPQAGVDIAELKKRIGDRVCLIGNVNCALLDTGSDQQVIEGTQYALRHGMPGGGYIFSSSNCIYTGMPLRRYELMLNVWRRAGNYPDDTATKRPETKYP
jgi:uroporphyrinogen decarboxylase